MFLSGHMLRFSKRTRGKRQKPTSRSRSRVPSITEKVNIRVGHASILGTLKHSKEMFDMGVNTSVRNLNVQGFKHEVRFGRQVVGFERTRPAKWTRLLPAFALSNASMSVLICPSFLSLIERSIRTMSCSHPSHSVSSCSGTSTVPSDQAIPTW